MAWHLKKRPAWPTGHHLRAPLQRDLRVADPAGARGHAGHAGLPRVAPAALPAAHVRGVAPVAHGHEVALCDAARQLAHEGLQRVRVARGAGDLRALPCAGRLAAHRAAAARGHGAAVGRDEAAGWREEVQRQARHGGQAAGEVDAPSAVGSLSDQPAAMEVEVVRPLKTI